MTAFVGRTVESLERRFNSSKAQLLQRLVSALFRLHSRFLRDVSGYSSSPKECIGCHCLIDLDRLAADERIWLRAGRGHQPEPLSCPPLLRGKERADDPSKAAALGVVSWANGA
jgi:hypothetical protein